MQQSSSQTHLNTMTLLAQSNSRGQATDARTDDQDTKAGVIVDFFDRHLAKLHCGIPTEYQKSRSRILRASGINS